jgi:hypothetical protein
LLPEGGLPILPASVGSGDYTGYLTVVPGEVLAEMYVKHGSRLLEGNVRTFNGRDGQVNKRISSTVGKESTRASRPPSAKIRPGSSPTTTGSPLRQGR